MKSLPRDTKTKYYGAILILILLSVVVHLPSNSAFAQPASQTTPTAYNGTIKEINENYSDINARSAWSPLPDVPESKLLFEIASHYDESGRPRSLTMHLKPELADLYQDLSASRTDRVVFVYPIFTQAAYSEGGFYDYYNKRCDSACLTVKIPNKVVGGYTSSMASAFALKLLNYSYITDIDIDKNPDILKKYEWVILLHSEYVTKKEFDAITFHPYVIYLYPNALFAEVKTDYVNDTITLVRGHGYPDSSIRNGFGWKYDNSNFEYDTKCKNWNYTEISNGIMLNCYPEFRVIYDDYLLRSLQQEDPATIRDHVSKWIRSDKSISDHDILYDFAFDGNYIPPWMKKTATFFVNGQLSQHDFGLAVNYLYNNGIIQ